MKQRKLQHVGPEETNVSEILFKTPFGYMFPDAAANESCLILHDGKTADALVGLANLMADPADNGPVTRDLDGPLPAVMTYLGQFIDHDVTAGTDRDESFRIGGRPLGDIKPVSPDEVVTKLVNGRRPTLDLDSLYGDGPGLAPGSTTIAQTLGGDGLYRSNLRMRLTKRGNFVDLPRNREGQAIIADERNDENIMIGQLHAGFLALHNAVMNGVRGPEFDTEAKKFVRARQLVRWTYQYIVAHEYLPMVCDPSVVADVQANGPRYLGVTTGRPIYMPLEFSVAGFRFGHSMIRPSYRLNETTASPINIMELLFPATQGKVKDIEGRKVLDPQFRVDWDFFVASGNELQFARKLDPRIARGLFDLVFGGNDPVLRHLAQRNLLRSFLLSIPTGQSVAECFGVVPIPNNQMAPDERFKTALERNELDRRTPLWYYVLREAQLQQGGARLGEVGSRIVAETLWGLIVSDPASFVHARHDPAVTDGGIALPLRGTRPVATIGDMLEAAGVRD